MSDDTPQVRQDNEFEALKSIFAEDLVAHHVNTAWKVWNPLDLSLKLNPLHNSNVPGIHCSVTLHVKCCHSYPERPPSISIESVQGISDEDIEELLKQLNTLAKKQCGEVMIFELAQHTQQFLYDHNTPSLSIYEEMVQENNEKEKLRLHDQQAKENEELKKMKDEIEKRREILRTAEKRVKWSSSGERDHEEGKGDAPELVCYADDNLSPARRIPRSGSIDLPCTCNTKGTQVLRVTQKNNRKFYVGNCLGHSANRSVTYLAIDESGDRFVVKKWFLSVPSDIHVRGRQMTSVQQDLKTMCRLNNSYLVPYIAMETPKEVVKGVTKQYIYLFRDFVLGCSLKFVKYKLDSLNEKKEALKLMRHAALGVFSALKELHSVDIVHRDVRCENVFMDDSGGIKLVGPSLDARLADISENKNNCDRQTKAHDIYAAAQMLLSIVSQDHCVEVPHSLPSSAKDFFSRCLIDDEYSLWSAAKLVTHGFLVDTPPQQITDKKDDSSEEDEANIAIHNISLPSSGLSRITEEFQILKWLGKGAFGDVLKVKNKLDGALYAIKRVKLNPESIQLNKKITREVKLLSHLNHENVVRYYSAWVEFVTEIVEDDTCNTRASSVKADESPEGTGAKLGQEIKVESIMETGNSVSHNEEEGEGEEQDEEPDPFFNISNEDESSYIEFEEVSKKSESIPSQHGPDTPTPQTSSRRQYLYIQMEFCEKNTLRHAIDNGLCNEHVRSWRLFREIVGGLAHVHRQGMIHRDLKPVNIFLDSYDHVKLGDFGLATKIFSSIPTEDKNRQTEELSGSLTGQVGTALYVAPELLQAVGKGIYNQKVDIYSLGIILFEMFHPPFNTGMERIAILTELRKKYIKMPENFVIESNKKQVHVIKWLLNHDPSLRPTCSELLASEHVPRSVAEGTMSGLLAYALSDNKSSGYQRLISACLSQKQTDALDFTFQSEMKSSQYDTLLILKDMITKIFRSHGAQEYSPPLLTPRANKWMKYVNAVKVMTSSGVVCHLAQDLRLPFARYLAYSHTKYMRRYVFERVYRERHTAGIHPREIHHCAFDIVTPKTDNLWSDAEVLVVACRAAGQSNLKIAVQLNHTELIRVLLLSFGIPHDKHADIYEVLNEFRAGRINNMQLQTHLTSLCMPHPDYIELNRLLEKHIPVYGLREVITQYVKRQKSLKVAHNALHEIEVLYRNATALGCDTQITVAPFLTYNITQHRGIFWKMSVINMTTEENKSKEPKPSAMIAAGGSYDSLVEEYGKVTRGISDGSESKIHAVGFSMDLEHMSMLMTGTIEDVPRANYESPLICVCVSECAGSGRDGQVAGRRAALARGAWAGGQRACLWPAGAHEAHEATRAPVELLLPQEEALVRVCYYDKSGARINKVPYNEVLDFVKKLNLESAKSPETSRSNSWNDEKNSPIISITYVTAGDKVSKNCKRQCENQISSQLSAAAQAVGLSSGGGWRARAHVHALAAACEASIVRALAAQLAAPLAAHALRAAFVHVCQLFPKRQDILEEVQNELTNMINSHVNQNRSEDVQLYALYSIPDSLLRLII